MQEVVLPTVQKSADAVQDARNEKLNAKRLIVPELQVGARVMIKDINRASSLEPRFIGPYTVVRKNRRGTYQLKDQRNVILHRAVPISQIKRCGAGALTNATGELVEDEKVQPRFVVKDILKHRKIDGVTTYLVRWEGYDDEHNSWEPASVFDDAATLTNYHRKKRKRKRG